MRNEEGTSWRRHREVSELAATPEEMPSSIRDQQSIDAYMTRAPHSIQYDELLDAARAMMKKHNICHLPVLQSGRVAGILSQHNLDLLEAVYGDSFRVMRAGERGVSRPALRSFRHPAAGRGPRHDRPQRRVCGRHARKRAAWNLYHDGCPSRARAVGFSAWHLG